MTRSLYSLALVVVLLLAITLPGYGEEAKITNCPCCCCADKETREDEEPKEDAVIEKTPKDLYVEWLDMARSLVESSYNLSTWVDIDMFSYWSVSDRTYIFIDAGFLLLEDMRCITKEQAIGLASAARRDKDSERYINNTYSFIHGVPTMLSLTQMARESLVTEVPSDYMYVDELICSVISRLEVMRNSLVGHIQEHGTLENWVNNSKDLLKEEMTTLRLILGFTN